MTDAPAAWRRALGAGLAPLALLAGCMPVLSPAYLPQVPAGALVYSTCRFNTHVPVGASLALGPATGVVLLAEQSGRPYVELRLEIPQGTELRLLDDEVAVMTDPAGPAARFRFPSVSLVDTPIVNSTSPLPALQAQQRPVTAPLVGATVQAGASRSGRHVWLATHIETGGAARVWVGLPRWTVDGAAQQGPRVEFRRSLVPGVALINC